MDKTDSTSLMVIPFYKYKKRTIISIISSNKGFTRHHYTYLYLYLRVFRNDNNI